MKDRNERAYGAMPDIFLAVEGVLGNPDLRSYMETRYPGTNAALWRAMSRIKNDLPSFRQLDHVRRLAEIHAWGPADLRSPKP